MTIAHLLASPAAPLLAASMLALAVSMPARADAITYKGTLGHIPIILEATEAADGEVIGRYSFLDVGADVPLYQISGPAEATILAEAARCLEPSCPLPDYGQRPALDEEWHFETAIGAERLTGTWKGKIGTSLRIDLTRIGERPYSRQEDDLYAAFAEGAYDAVITAKTMPYEYFKMQVPYLGEARILPGGSYHMVTDPRTKFPFPRVLTLADNSDIGPVNAFLQQMHWSVSTDALACLSDTYLSGGFDSMRPDGYSRLGDYDYESVEVLYLSPKIMTIVRSGSVSCGSASPFNHAIYTNIDVAAGTEFDLGRVFAGWKQDADGLGKADTALLDYVSANRPKDEAFDEDCGVEAALRAGGLAISFLEGDRAEFRLVGTGQAACDGPLFDVALKDIPQLLTPEAATIFPSLGQ